ncbi:MAG: hypothetical protein QJT81_09925 [Candidatus Thiothrix putei]|uniref:Uncharacterized protein n=1 Tax=Candidatus Thiothrix putei TaxID=3080811 RepID=A0AA95KS15_9GAMM|nr:MAG: hypothetical protein QJT81_09925 [Candidatus Thiothrix putei]
MLSPSGAATGAAAGANNGNCATGISTGRFSDLLPKTCCLNHTSWRFNSETACCRTALSARNPALSARNPAFSSRNASISAPIGGMGTLVSDGVDGFKIMGLLYQNVAAQDTGNA